MTRRLLGPIGGPILFFLVAGLVFAGLGWVTVAALKVEEAQREAARRADREKELRIALWRLDARMLPALGVEDTRPFHEFKTYSADDPITVYGPASAPLLASDLPDWMQLHFQLDPDGTWESPQVLDKPTRIALRRNWPELPLRNVTKPREELLASLSGKFPARQASDAFAARERTLPPISPATHPLTSNGTTFEDGDGMDEVRKDLAAPKAEPGGKPAPVVAPVPPAKVEAGAEALTKAKDATLALQPSTPMSRTSGENETLRVDAPAPLPPPAPEPQAQPIAPAENPAKPADGKPANRGLEQKRFDYDERQSVLGKGLGDAARPMFQLPRSGNSLQQQGNSTNGSKSAPGGIAGAYGRAASPPPVTKRSEAEDRFYNFNPDPKGSSTDKAFREQPSGGFGFNGDFKKVESDPLGFYRLIEEAKSKERERQQLDNLHRGALKKESDKAPDSAKGVADTKNLMAKGMSVQSAGGGPPPGLPGLGGAPAGPAGPRPMTTAPLAGGVPGPVPSSAPPSPKAPVAPPVVEFGAPGGGGLGTALGAGTTPPPARNPVPPTPDPAPAAELEPVDLPAPPMMPPAADDFTVAPPLAVHLGSLRPQWLTAPDGTQLLVLVRTARVENKKIVYQGVILDWAKLQALLQDEVKDLFPGANLEPVKEPTAASREQSMTALPVHLDPGPEPELPPAGWTPLRMGLVLAWVAALIAFAAVGLSGWSLVDLAERRIRFVSAVTHELRTPLTSLRLYLDLLLSGMVQDEEKRREYLSTLNVESDRLHRLIDNVLDFAKLERSRKGRDLQPAIAADLIESARRTWAERVAADGKELVVISTLPPDLEVQTDAALVHQIVGNLIDNARKYTREATDARIWLWARVETGTRVVFEVEDRGPGVPPREQKTIFKPFRRGESADTRAGGAGLGLALSKEWAEVLGGKLIYRTPEGGAGSCFRLELPLK